MDITAYYTKAKQLSDESNAISGLPRCECIKCECGINEKLYKHSEERKLI